jgi:hydrogenase maturation protease
MATRAKTLIIGLGNPILGDDGVGWRIADASQALCEDAIDADQVQFECSSSGGLGLMERMVGYERAILTDAMVTAERHVGSIHSKPLSSVAHWAAAHFNSSHDTTLHAALETGRQMGWPLPKEIWVVAVEIEPTYIFSETLSSAVAAAVPEAAKLVQARLMAQPTG